jgi:hypothetical protein
MRTRPHRPVSQAFAVPAEYVPLHKYLSERFADTVVLTFAEIEDLLGIVLPAAARVEADWWTNADAETAQTPQSRSWIRADRSAKANLSAQVAAFERNPS